MKTKLVFLLVLSVLTLTACAELENGYHYFCPGKSVFDVVQESPPIIRFKCESRDFIVEFLGPDNKDFPKAIRNLSLGDDIGVILGDTNEVIQIYSTASGSNDARQKWPQIK